MQFSFLIALRNVVVPLGRLLAFEMPFAAKFDEVADKMTEQSGRLEAKMKIAVERVQESVEFIDCSRILLAQCRPKN